MKGVKIELLGVQAEINRLAKAKNDIAAEVDAIISADGNDMADESVAMATTAFNQRTGTLRSRIGFHRNGPFKYEYVAQTNYAAYVEFGTGGLVDVPRGLESYALQFKGKGIKEVNLPARPYFFPPFFKWSRIMVANIKKKLLEKRG